MISKQEREHHLSTFEADAGHCDRRFICTFPQSTVYTGLLDTANFFGFVTHSVANCLQIKLELGLDVLAYTVEFANEYVKVPKSTDSR